MNPKKLVIGVVLLFIIIILLGFAFTQIFERNSGGLGEGKDVPLFGSDTRVMAPEANSNQGTSQVPLKKVIKTGSLQLVVEDTTWSVNKIREIAEQHRGFIESSQISDNGEGRKHGWVTVRVPSDQFSEVFDQIKSFAQIVEIENMGGQDVTQQYIDMEARLKNLRSTEAQYLEILKRAQTIEDILKVQQLVSQARAEIESMEAQLKYLGTQVDFATITVNLSQEPTIALSLKDFRPLTIINTSVQALARGLIIIFNVLVSIIIVGLPLVLVVLVLIWILWRIIIVIKNRYSR